MRQSPGPHELMKIWVRLILVGFATMGCASAKSDTDHRIGLLGVWFTNLQTVPSQNYSAARPQDVYPEVKVFERARDSRVIMVIAFSTGDSHSLRAVLKDAKGGQRPVEWSIVPMPRVSTGGDWRTTTAWWSIDRLMPGTYLVELTIDTLPIGTYVFGVN